MNTTARVITAAAGALLVLGGAGGVEHSVDNVVMLQSLAVSLVGLALIAVVIAPVTQE